MNQENSKKVFDYIVIGSGFGGSVSAMRLAEKGYSVLVIEKGKWWKAEDFPKSNWNLKKFLWVPALRWFGIMKLDFFREVFILSGTGVGGGSLVYANTHMDPDESFWTNPVWAGLKDWKSTLQPYYEKARKMLGSTPYNKEYPEDRLLRQVAADMGREKTYKAVDSVGIYASDRETPRDPYFSGLGPLRSPCKECAGCMVGCRYNAKNTLDKNYLHFALHFGAEIVAETLATRIEFKDGLYLVHTQSQTGKTSHNNNVYKSKGIVFSGGVLGTLKLLLEQKHIYRTLPLLSDKLGENILTNSEMIAGVGYGHQKLNHGIAISRVFKPDDNTYVELCKYPDGSDALIRLGVPATGPGHPLIRSLKLVYNLIRNPKNIWRMATAGNIAQNSLILLIMQALPGTMKMKISKGILGNSLKFDKKTRVQIPSYIPIGQKVAEKYAQHSQSIPLNAFNEVIFGMSTTAHIMGGCPIGKSIDHGVVDSHFRVWGYPDMYILDGSIIPANLGVNPSLTITALSEYAMDRIPPSPEKKNRDLDELLEELKTSGHSHKTDGDSNNTES